MEIIPKKWMKARSGPKQKIPKKIADGHLNKMNYCNN